jgi:hypothetical protein
MLRVIGWLLILVGVGIIIPGFMNVVYQGGNWTGMLLIAAGVVVGMVGRALAFKKK